MKTTRDLTRKLGKAKPEWRTSELTDRDACPLILAGVLKYSHLSAQYECRHCDADCPGVLKYFNRSRDDNKRLELATHCLLDQHLIEINPVELAIWKYDSHRLAELICEALDCEGVLDMPSGQFYNLGQSRIRFGRYTRQICVADRVDDTFFQRLKTELPVNQSYLLLVGKLDCTIADEQLRRRVFIFDDILRFRPDGRLEIVFDLIESQLGEPISSQKRKKRSDLTTTENRIAEYLLRIASYMLSSTDPDEQQEFRDRCLSFDEISKEVEISSSKISENYLGKRCLKQDINKPHRLFYHLLKEPGNFIVFREYANSQQCPISQMTPVTVFAGISVIYAEHIWHLVKP